MKHLRFYFYILIVLILTSACALFSTASPTKIEVTPQTMNLSINDLDSTTPQGVLNEISYFGGMGGIGDDCMFYDFNSPTILIDPTFENPHRNGVILIHICGLSSEDKNVDIQVELPDGALKYYQLSSTLTPDKDYYQIDYYSIVELNDPLGEYHFVFTGSGWALDQYLIVSDLTVPSLILDTDANELIFTKFQPDENVQLLVYVPTDGTNAKLIGWKNFQVDESGQLIIHLESPSPDNGYIAIGSTSGVVNLYRKGDWSPSWLYAPAEK